MQPSKRKLIILSEPQEVSPLKEVPQSFPKTDVPKSGLKPLPELEQVLKQEQMDEIERNPKNLIALQLCRTAVKCRKRQLEANYLSQNEQIVKKCFDQTINLFMESLAEIRKERIEKIQQDQLVFIPSNHDSFEHHKGRVLDNIIKETLTVVQAKRNFSHCLQQNKQLLKGVEEVIISGASEIEEGAMKEILEPIVSGFERRKEEQVKSMAKKAKERMRQALQVSEDMWEIEWEREKLDDFEKMGRMKKGELRKYSKQISQAALLFRCEDYLF